MGIGTVIPGTSAGANNWQYNNAYPLAFYRNFNWDGYDGVSAGSPAKISFPGTLNLYNNTYADFFNLQLCSKDVVNGSSYVISKVFKSAFLLQYSEEPYFTNVFDFNYVVTPYKNEYGTIKKNGMRCVAYDGLTNKYTSADDALHMLNTNFGGSLFYSADVQKSISGSYIYLGGMPIFDDLDSMTAYLNDDTFKSYTSYGGKEYYYLSENSNIDPTNPTYNSDAITGLNSKTGIGYGSYLSKFNSLAVINKSNLENLSTLMNTLLWKDNCLSSIESLKIIKTPSNISTSTTNSTIIDPSSILPSLSVKGDLITYQYELFTIGTFNISGYYGSFLDYEPYSSIQLYLPYCGIQNISCKDILGSDATLKCSIDYLTGNIVYFLSVVSNGIERVIYQWNGNCSCEISITTEDYASKIMPYITSLLAIGSAAALTVATGGTGTALAATAVASASSTLLNDATNTPISSCGSISAGNGFSAIQYPYIIYRYPKAAYPVNYSAIKGRPCRIYDTLSNYQGFTVVDEVHFNNLNCTVTELNEIKQLLSEGVDII